VKTYYLDEWLVILTESSPIGYRDNIAFLNCCPSSSDYGKMGFSSLDQDIRGMITSFDFDQFLTIMIEHYRSIQKYCLEQSGQLGIVNWIIGRNWESGIKLSAPVEQRNGKDSQ
jgi:hypothetical protein